MGKEIKHKYFQEQSCFDFIGVARIATDGGEV